MSCETKKSGSSLAGLRVLVVDDEPDIRRGICRLVELTGACAMGAGSAEEALALLPVKNPDIVLTDIRMPGMSGIDLMKRLRAERPAIAVILITGFGTIAQAVECLQNGASHFLTKPFDNDELVTIVSRVGRRILGERGAGVSSSMPWTDGLIRTQDERMKQALETVRQAASMRVPVLVTGESGTGKELVARTVHAESGVRDKVFLAVNCAALPDTLLESELFGYRRGAFTGAVKDHRGIFSQAQGGSVFLDEVSSMSLAFQGKLLRVLQERVVRPLGANRDEPVDFRLICATNRDLRPMVERGQFREDLFYRLCVVVIHLPPLRERRGDVPLLARYFLERAARECLAHPAEAPTISDDALAELAEYDWPGNVRELENTIRRALVMCRGAEIRPEHLFLYGDAPGSSQGDGMGASYEEAKNRALQKFQRQFITRALERTGGNVSRAAAECGLTRAALQKIMRTLDLDREDFAS